MVSFSDNHTIASNNSIASSCNERGYLDIDIKIMKSCSYSYHLDFQGRTVTRTVIQNLSGSFESFPSHSEPFWVIRNKSFDDDHIDDCWYSNPPDCGTRTHPLLLLPGKSNINDYTINDCPMVSGTSHDNNHSRLCPPWSQVRSFPFRQLGLFHGVGYVP